MTFKSLIIFALVASVGHVVAAPLAGGHLGARTPCKGIWCTRHTIGGGRSDLSGRFAEFDGSNVTLSNRTPGKPTAVDPPATPVDPSPTSLSVDPSSTPSVDPSSTDSVDPSLTSPVDDPVTETPEPTIPAGGGSSKPPSSTSDGIPQATEPAADGPVTITVVSTVFLSATDPAASLPTESPASSDGVVSSSPAVGPSPTVSEDPLSPTLSVKPSSTVPEDGVTSSPTPIEPSGIFASASSLFPSVSPPNDSSVKESPPTSTKVKPTATPSPTIIELSDGIPSSSVSSTAAGQPTPPPTPGVIFLPPSDDALNP